MVFHQAQLLSKCGILFIFYLAARSASLSEAITTYPLISTALSHHE